MSECRKQRVLIVDDEEVNRKLFSVMLEESGYVPVGAADGVQALEKARECSPDLILLDVMMPGIDGFETCRSLKEDQRTQQIPVVMVTALGDTESRIKGLTAGANDFVTKPVNMMELMLRTRNLLRLKEFETFHTEMLEAEVTMRTEQMLLSQQSLKQSYVDMIQRLTIVAEFKDEDTGSHIKRTSLYCALIAKQLGWTDDRIELISHASPMHDIGKVGIPSDIILKPGRLNREEFELMKLHAIIGSRILHGSDSPLLAMAERITLGHHERWSGGGYPLGISGEEIPVEGRIMNIADQYDALRSRRPYKAAFDHETAFGIITEGDDRSSPSHFDPMLLEIFKDVHVRFRDIFDTFRDTNPGGRTRHAGKGNHPSSEAAGRSRVDEGSSFR